jgi:hypothetical protein
MGMEGEEDDDEDDIGWMEKDTVFYSCEMTMRMRRRRVNQIYRHG